MNTESTPIQRLKPLQNNNLYIKREDLIPYSFGGNKARKAELFFKDLEKSGCDCVVTYGSGSSNHCRIVSNMAAQKGIPCYIISPDEASEETNNSILMRLFGARITVVPVSEVHDTIEHTVSELRASGKAPYFIPGGGHGNIGTQAYVNCYEEIKAYEIVSGISFDYIFFASGTGTTQAGLVCGKMLHKDEKKIVGISIARKSPRGREIILDSVRDYFGAKGKAVSEEDIENSVVFCDSYVGDGYAKNDPSVLLAISDMMRREGIPLDSTYTGKAYHGMCSYSRENGIEGKNILFIHTGGTPLFFDDLKEKVKDNPRLPKWSGELYLEFHRGTLTSQARNKRYNRKTELLMHDCETLNAMAHVLSDGQYPAEELLADWKLILLNQFHDIIPGSCVQESREYAMGLRTGACKRQTDGTKRYAVTDFRHAARQRQYCRVQYTWLCTFGRCICRASRRGQLYCSRQRRQSSALSKDF